MASEEDNEQSSDSWLITYADLFTLLFAFFVLIAASGSIDQGKFDKIRESISKSLDKSVDNSLVKEMQEKRINRENLKKQMLEVLKVKQLDNLASIEENKKGLKISFPSKILFKSASASLEQEFTNVLKEIVEILKLPDFNQFKITVEGHTDDLAIHTEKYPSNWELSASRAASVVNYMTAKGFDKTHVKVAGYADSIPIKNISNGMSEEEKSEVRQKNRRIELQIIYYKDQF